MGAKRRENKQTILGLIVFRTIILKFLASKWSEEANNGSRRQSDVGIGFAGRPCDAWSGVPLACYIRTLAPTSITFNGPSIR